MTDLLANPDTYDPYYEAKLWALVPAVYRSLDPTGHGAVDAATGPMQELLNRVASQVAEVRRSIDRLWEDQSIESCDSWVISYLAQLLDTNLVPSMDRRGQRLDVANTIYYRRRKGTVALLEQLAADVTGYESHVVEFFRRLARRRHGLDPAIGYPAGTGDPAAALALQRAELLSGLLTGTPAGGFADLRVPLGADCTCTAYDEYSHTVDVRIGRGATGWYGIPKIGVFFWRVVSLGVDRATPVPVAGCPDHYCFDPTGRQIPLFQAAARGANDYGESWLSLPAWQLPMPLTTPMWQALAIAGTDSPSAYPDPLAAVWPNSLAIRMVGDPAPLPLAAVKVWPEVGRFAVTGATPDVEVGYHYGLFSRIGAGPFDRRQLGIGPVADPAPVLSITGGSAITLPNALNALNALSALSASGTIVVTDGLTLSDVAAVGTPATPIGSITVRAADEGRAVIRVPPGAGPWVFEGAAAAATHASQLRLEGLLVSGADIVLRGTFEEVVLSCCTLDPGSRGDLCTPPQAWQSSVDGLPLAPTRVWVEGTVRCLVVDRCILGPIRTRNGGLIECLSANDSIVQGLPSALGAQLSLSSVMDADGLLRALHHRRDPLSDWLSAELSATSAAVVAAHADGSAVSDTDLQHVVDDLQAVLDGVLVWTAERFADRPLRSSTLAAVATPPAQPALATLNRQLLAEAYPLALADAALATDAGVVELCRCTVLGPAYVHRLECSESILDDVARVINAQDGCVRFSAWSTDSALPRRYECVQVEAGSPVFGSRRYGEWAYAMVSDGADTAILASNTAGPPSILTGSHDGSEMGAFCRDGAAVKDRSLLIKFREYLPIGLSAVLLHMPAQDSDGELTRGKPWPPT
jgi:hypothetical protein